MMATMKDFRGAVVAAIVLLVVGLSGCSHRPDVAAPEASPGPGTAAIPEGRSDQTIEVDGRIRTYHLYRPATLATPGVPLVVMLHGGFGSGTQAERSYGWDGEADHAHFLVAYPDGLHRAWSTGGGCCGQPARDNIDDVAFLTAMITAIERRVPVDTHRVYATGISNGGIMAYTLACRTTVFAAIGPDSATQLGDCPHPAPISVIHIHGTADQRIPYTGGVGSAGTAHIDGPSAPALNASWRGIDRCTLPASTTAPPVTTSIAVCPNGRAVQLITITGAGHQWPGSTSRPVLQKLLNLDPPSTALDATSTIWQFFNQHPAP
jgi:polyhydroxybutyrate depolymerase